MKPTPAPSHFPYTSHRNMAQVMRDEERQRQRYTDNYKSWRRA